MPISPVMEIKDLAELHSAKAGSNSLALENFSGEFFPSLFQNFSLSISLTILQRNITWAFGKLLGFSQEYYIAARPLRGYATNRVPAMT
jgi:hypothetical protein